MTKDNKTIFIMKSLLIISLVWFLCVIFIFPNNNVVLRKDDTITMNEDETTDSAVIEGSVDGPYLFYYEQLSSNSKKSYDELLQAFNKLDKKVKISVSNVEEIKKIYNAVLYDHPEIFWVSSGYEYSFHAGIKEDVYTITPSYFYDKKEVNEKRNEIEKITKEILRKVDSDLSEYEKLLFVYEYIVENVQYDTKYYVNNRIYELQNIDSSLIDNLSVCAGYSKMTQYLLNKMGVFASYVTGEVVKPDEENGLHAWNLVKCDGEYYYLDSTWGDPIFNESDSDVLSSNINYKYFCCNDEIINKTHSIDDSVFEYPSCDSIENNYYHKNNLYYEDYNEEELKQVLKNDIESGEEVSRFMFKEQEDYKKANTFLIKYAVLLSQNKQISYSLDDMLYSFEIYWR